MRMCSTKLSAFGCWALLVFCLFPALIARGASATPTSKLGLFPAIQATSLDHTRLSLPKDFSGKLNLVVIYFAREQQKEVDTWIPAARQIQSSHHNFNYYELPTMSHENVLSRWWFDAALRSDTTDKNLRGHVLTAYVNKRKFLQSLHIASDKQVESILVDRTGQVFWHTSGPFTEQAKLSLQATLAANGI